MKLRMKTDPDTLARLHCSILLYTGMNQEIKLPAIFVSDLLFEIDQLRSTPRNRKVSEPPMECDWCGNGFTTESYDLEDGRVFCSEMCRAQGEAGRQM
jgi:formylmethanofuran dehydrogenase subunit E